MPEQTPPPQQQTPPGETGAMAPEPRDEMRGWVGRDLLAGKVALVTGGDSSTIPTAARSGPGHCASGPR